MSTKTVFMEIEEKHQYLLDEIVYMRTGPYQVKNFFG